MRLTDWRGFSLFHLTYMCYYLQWSPLGLKGADHPCRTLYNYREVFFSVNCCSVWKFDNLRDHYVFWTYYQHSFGKVRAIVVSNLLASEWKNFYLCPIKLCRQKESFYSLLKKSWQSLLWKQKDCSSFLDIISMGCRVQKNSL